MSKIEMIALVDCVDLSSEIEEYLLEEHDYRCHYDHTVLQIHNDGNIFAEWLKANGYQFKSNQKSWPDWDLVALFGT
uniref:Uncharacterized protein n=1 Tax=viral metagenome TaxID=1070528 RepID=A0A6M3L755_9ZZZZ